MLFWGALCRLGSTAVHQGVPQTSKVTAGQERTDLREPGSGRWRSLALCGLREPGLGDALPRQPNPVTGSTFPVCPIATSLLPKENLPSSSFRHRVLCTQSLAVPCPKVVLCGPVKPTGSSSYHLHLGREARRWGPGRTGLGKCKSHTEPVPRFYF